MNNAMTFGIRNMPSKTGRSKHSAMAGERSRQINGKAVIAMDTNGNKTEYSTVTDLAVSLSVSVGTVSAFARRNSEFGADKKPYKGLIIYFKY